MALTDNLVAYYKLDEISGNASDSSGNGYTLTNSNVYYATAKINNGASFDNAADYLTNTGFPSMSSFSCSFWFKVGTEQAMMGIVDMYIGASGWRVWAGSTWNAILLSCNLTHWTYALDPTPGTWYHGVFTYNSGTAKFYLNGSLVDTKTISSLTPQTTFTIGNSSSTKNSGFNGLVDEVGAWSRALSASEVAELYNSGAGLAYPFSTGTMIKRWNGTAWEEKPLKRYNGSEWENITIKRYNVSSWNEI